MKSSPLVRQASTEKESTKSENLTEYLIEAIVEGQLAPGSKKSLNLSSPNSFKSAVAHCVKR